MIDFEKAARVMVENTKLMNKMAKALHDERIEVSLGNRDDLSESEQSFMMLVKALRSLSSGSGAK